MHSPIDSSSATTPKPVSKCPFSRLLKRSQTGLADTLKERTKEAHTRAERHPLQARLVAGALTREEYSGYLAQLLPVWTALDAGLDGLAVRDSRVASMVQPYHRHAWRLVDDLAFLNHREQRPVPATQRFLQVVADAASGSGIGLLGVWYVLEGSANGGRFIAKALSRGLGIVGPDGLKNFDPHGEHQRERWQAWRTALDAQAFSESERDAIVACASATFDAIYDVMVDLESQRQPN
ncbi:MAG: biliverdin-producing heme oxygenase [Phycisphaerae bacterium]|nr:biliverdin-producing heme oxygenase [Phycisphaerae bacterium]